MTYKTLAEQEQERQARLQDDSIMFAGRTHSNVVHLIRGEKNKAQRSTTTSICGKTVGNTHREPNANEKICSYCQSGRQAQGFSRYNQPRDCADCGRKFADSAKRDSNDALCPDCYEKAGIINEHLDGGHRDERDPECPECQQSMEAAETDPSPDHRIHSDAGQLLSDCDECVAALKADMAEVRDPLDVPTPMSETGREIAVGEAVHDALEKTQEMARQLRALANRITLMGEQIVNPLADPVECAASVLRDVEMTIHGMSSTDLVLIASRLRRAREA